MSPTIQHFDLVRISDLFVGARLIVFRTEYRRPRIPGNNSLNHVHICACKYKRYPINNFYF